MSNALGHGKLLGHVPPDSQIAGGQGCVVMLGVGIEIEDHLIADLQRAGTFRPTARRVDRSVLHFIGASDHGCRRDPEVFHRGGKLGFVLEKQDRPALEPQDRRIDAVEPGIEEELCRFEPDEILRGRRVDAMVIVVLPLQLGRRESAGNCGGPEDHEALHGRIINDFGRPAVSRRGFVLHHRNGLLIGPCDEIPRGRVADGGAVPAIGPNHVKDAIWSGGDAGIAHQLRFSDHGLEERFAILERFPFQAIGAPREMKPVLAVAKEIGK